MNLLLDVRLRSYWKTILVAAVAGSLFVPVFAHNGEHASVHDTVAGIAERLKHDISEQDLKALTPYRVEQFLTEEEKHVLGTQHIRFNVNVPVVVSIFRDRSLNSEPFWIRENDFKLSGLTFDTGQVQFDVWQKSFPTGEIGLGICSLAGGGTHYLPVLSPQNAAERIEVSDLYPATLRSEVFAPGVKPYVDEDYTLSSVPDEFRDHLLIRCEYASRDDAKLVNLFRWTNYPASKLADQIVLTWSDDPKTTQTIQWRTSLETTDGFVAYQKMATMNQFQPRSPRKIKAVNTRLDTPNIINEPSVYRHVATLTELEPATQYVYSVGDGSAEGWSVLSEFTTAPEGERPFSFIYMGDAQNGLDRWGTLVHNAFRDRPDAAFYIMAGDLVNRGNERDDWDSFFFNAEGIYDRRQLVPAIGNHENQGGDPWLYLDLFTLPLNGPEKVQEERAYSFEYSNTLFVVLDTNIDPESQDQWLEKTLSESDATWKIAVFHHPAYSSAPRRDNINIRKHWIPIFDRHHVDLALQGHDHGYLRTFPMHGNKVQETPEDGTIYIVSVSGTKMYDQVDREYKEFGMTKVATYQVLDIQISGDRLVYRAFDIDGDRRDEFIIEK